MRLPPDVKDESASPAATSPDSTNGDGAHATPGAGRVNEANEPRSHVLRREFEFPGDLESVPESREKIMQFICLHCPDEGDQIDILVALQEALANAALHGCGDDPAKKIQCTVALDASEITITVRDPGAGFDLTLADPENYSASKLTHGRGIRLIRSLMTDVAFARGGSEIRMQKHIECH